MLEIYPLGKIFRIHNQLIIGLSRVLSALLLAVFRVRGRSSQSTG